MISKRTLLIAFLFLPILHVYGQVLVQTELSFDYPGEESITLTIYGDRDISELAAEIQIGDYFNRIKILSSLQAGELKRVQLKPKDFPWFFFAVLTTPSTLQLKIFSDGEQVISKDHDLSIGSGSYRSAIVRYALYSENLRDGLVALRQQFERELDWNLRFHWRSHLKRSIVWLVAKELSYRSVSEFRKDQVLQLLELFGTKHFIPRRRSRDAFMIFIRNLR